MLNKLLLGAAVLALAAPASAVLAQDDYYGWQHQADHQEHREQHQEQRAAHSYAHAVGAFDNEWDHQAYHEAVRDQHDQFHDEHPGTRHDHRWGQQSYQNGYGYSYSPYGQNYGRTTYRSYSPYGYNRGSRYGYTGY